MFVAESGRVLCKRDARLTTYCVVCGLSGEGEVLLLPGLEVASDTFKEAFEERLPA